MTPGNMTPLERLAFGLYATNIFVSAKTHGIKLPCGERIEKAWNRNAISRQRWIKTAAEILANTPGIDLGVLTGHTGEFPHVVGSCVPAGEHRRANRSAAAFCFIIGAAAGAIVALLGVVEFLQNT